VLSIGASYESLAQLDRPAAVSCGKANNRLRSTGQMTIARGTMLQLHDRAGVSTETFVSDGRSA